jgi:GT2 family glycosyltransferase
MAQVETRASQAARPTKGGVVPNVLVVLVVKGGDDWLRQCLLSLSKQTHPRIGVLAVDLTSSDSSAELLESVLGGNHVLRLAASIGSSAAVGEALRSDLAGQADYVLLLGDDTVLAPEAVARMVEAAHRIEGVGIVGPKILDWEDPRILRDVGRSADRFGYPYSPLEEEEIDQGQYDRIREVLFVSSCAMLVSRQVWGRIGPPDERLTANQEDLDFCWRARLAGFRVLMTPGAVARHRGDAVKGERWERTRRDFHYQRERAALLGTLKNYGLLSLLWILPAHLAQAVVRVLFLASVRRFEHAFQILAAWGWNAAHLPGTLRRRVRAQAVRAVPDRTVRRTMAPTWIRLRRLAMTVGEVLLPDRAAAQATPAPAVFVRVVRMARAHPVALASVLGVVLGVVAYRHLLVASPLYGAGLSAFPDGPSGFIRELFSGLRHTGLGGTTPASPALGLLGGGSLVALGSPALLQKMLLLGLPAAAAVGCYRAARSHVSAAPAVVAAVTYGLSSVLLWAVSEGRIQALVLLAGLPWLTEKIRVAFDGTRAVNPVRWMAGAGLGLAVLVSFYPAAALAIAVIVLSCLVVPSGTWRRRRGIVLTGGSAAVASVLALPVVVGLLGAGGYGLFEYAGEPSFAALARLSPGEAPGDWPTGYFLPVAAGVALLFVSGRQTGTALRSAVAATGSLFLAWLSAAGYLPLALSNAIAYLGVAAVAMAILVGLGLQVLTTGVAGQAFGHRQIGAGLLAALLGVGLFAQGIQAASGSWAVGGTERVPAAYPLVNEAESAFYRVLWIARPKDGAFPAPGGLAEATAAAGPASVMFAVTAPGGSSALDIGRAPAGPGYRELRRALAEILSGDTRHGGSLLAPFGIRYVVSVPGYLPVRTARGLGRQFDLDLVKAEGLMIFRNAKAVPLGVEISDPGWREAATSGEMRTVLALPAPGGTPLEELEAGHAYRGEGPSAPALILLSQQFDPRWTLIPSDGTPAPPEPEVAFGWATGFQAPADPLSGYEVRFDGQASRTIEVGILGVLWLAALWITRRPVRGG